LGLVLFLVLPVCTLAQARAEVSCDNGVNIDKAQALVKTAATALAKDQAAVIQQINYCDKAWKDGDFYVVVLEGPKILAHGYVPAMVGQDMATLAYYRELATAIERMLAQKSQGCVGYKAPKPTQLGQLEDKVS
jgi:hypothetical protein